MALFRGAVGAVQSVVVATRLGNDRRVSGRGGAAMLLAVIWLLGLVALGAVIAFEQRVDSARQAQVVIAQMHIQQGNLLAIAFAPATAAKTSADSRELTKLRLTEATIGVTSRLSTVSRRWSLPALRRKPRSSTEPASGRAESNTA